MSVINKEKKALDWIEKNKKQIANMSDAIWRYAEPALRE